MLNEIRVLKEKNQFLILIYLFLLVDFELFVLYFVSLLIN